METAVQQKALPFHELFEQLAVPEQIRASLETHAPLAHGLVLPDAPFWTPSQAAFLREAFRLG